MPFEKIDKCKLVTNFVNIFTGSYICRLRDKFTFAPKIYLN